MIGYLYQCELALLELADRSWDDPAAEVRMEVLDDIEFLHGSGTPAELLQSKHRGVAGQLSETGKDFWRSVASRIDALSKLGNPGAESMPLLRLVTTQVATKGTFSLNAWKRPESRGAPYTAGIIPQPSENSLIDHDVHVAGRVFGLDSDWVNGSGARCDINVLWDSSGRRRLEVTNVNALPLESRTGTDMIYCHVPTKSFTFVQYRRLDPRRREIRVDERLRSQLDRLEKVAQLNSPPTQPHEWHLGSDPCFLKLAYWPEDPSRNPVEGLAHGMYLPVSYVRILLENDCTRGPQKGGQARLLGYDRVERHLVGAQFVDLVKEGLVGTVGTTREKLWSMVKRRASEGQNVLVAEENSSESARDRQERNRTRTVKDNSHVHKVYRQESLFGPDSEQ